MATNREAYSGASPEEPLVRGASLRVRHCLCLGAREPLRPGSIPGAERPANSRGIPHRDRFSYRCPRVRFSEHRDPILVLSRLLGIARLSKDARAICPIVHDGERGIPSKERIEPAGIRGIRVPCISWRVLILAAQMAADSCQRS